MRVLLLSLLLCSWVCVSRRVALSRQFMIRSLAGLMFVALFLVGIKYHSSLGRLHIWHIDMQLLLQQSWWHGVGPNGFNVAYNHAQAAWFAQASLYTQRAMLANDGYFAFNEFMQLAIEYGWWAGVALFLAFAAFIYQQYLLVKHRVPIVSVAFIATQLLWPIAIGCWVAYPLHTWYGPAIAISLSACIIVSYIIRHRAMRGGIVLAMLLGTVTFLYVANHNRQAEKKLLGNLRELWQIGHKTAAMEQLSAYCRTHPLAIPHHETLAVWHWLSGKEKEAIQTLEMHHQQHCNQRLHQQLGQWYAFQHNNEMASYHLHTSLYITPHLLTSRAFLADFYSRNGSIDSAKYWVNEVVNYPPKVPSPKADHLKKQATAWLNNQRATGSIFHLISN